MEFKDYYKILGIKKNASDKEISSAYRKLARKFHPDLNPKDASAKQNFQEVNEANEVLSDPIKRSTYDQYGKDWKYAEQFEKSQSQHKKSPNSEVDSSRYSEEYSNKDFSDFFETLFGQASNRGETSQVKFRGQDLNATLNLNLKDVYKSNQQTLIINDQKIRITIPAGVTDGQTLKIAGQGGLGANGGPNGDLLVTFNIANNTNFKRIGSDLYSDVNLNLYSAILGGEIIINTFDGQVKLTIKPETQHDSKLKLKGKGFPIYKKDHEFGDLYISFKIKIPTNLSQKEKDLFRELATLRSNNHE